MNRANLPLENTEAKNAGLVYFAILKSENWVPTNTEKDWTHFVTQVVGSVERMAIVGSLFAVIAIHPEEGQKVYVYDGKRECVSWAFNIELEGANQQVWREILPLRFLSGAIFDLHKNICRFTKSATSADWDWSIELFHETRFLLFQRKT